MTLLMHVCCAPCFVYPLSILESENIDVKALFYNPNIHPESEFSKRLENVEVFCKSRKIILSPILDFEQSTWEKFSGSDSERCIMCYKKRLEKTALVAKKLGFDAFSTTLLVSPYQKHEYIKDLCNKAAHKHNITFYYKDFRTGFREGQAKAKQIGLYTQKYCGCILSKKQ